MGEGVEGILRGKPRRGESRFCVDESLFLRGKSVRDKNGDGGFAVLSADGRDESNLVRGSFPKRP